MKYGYRILAYVFIVMAGISHFVEHDQPAAYLSAAWALLLGVWEVCDHLTARALPPVAEKDRKENL